MSIDLSFERKITDCPSEEITGSSGGPKGVLGTGDPLSVQILSFSCNLQQKCCQIIGWCAVPLPVSGVGTPWEIMDPPLGSMHSNLSSDITRFILLVKI